MRKSPASDLFKNNIFLCECSQLWVVYSKKNDHLKDALEDNLAVSRLLLLNT